MGLKTKLKKMLKKIENEINNSEEIWEKEDKDIVRWHNEDKNNDFISFLVNLSKEQGIVKSGMFDDTPEKLTNYSLEEFHILFETFERAISVYAVENFINDKYDMDEELYLEESSIVVKIDENFYKVESFIGNNTYITFEKEYDFIPGRNNYVDYELMIRNRKSPKYEETIKELIFEDLDDIKDKILASNISIEVLKEALEQYIVTECKLD